jgi:hypothetical protein
MCSGESSVMDDKFWEVVNRYIDKANEIKEETSMPQASSSLLYAAARYNALNIISRFPKTESEAEIKKHIDIYEEFLRNSFNHLNEQDRT